MPTMPSWTSDLGGQGPLVACSTGTTPLPPGEYELYVSLWVAPRTLVLDDGTARTLDADNLTVTSPAHWVDVVRGPIALTVTP